MPTRVRKLLGSFGVLVFLAAYVWIVTILSDHVPRNIAVQTLFFVAAGVLWGVPLIPLIRWMNAGPSSRPDEAR
jgi:hypothetical protein